MGFFDKVFGKKEQYPPLQQDHSAMNRLQGDMKGLEALVSDVTDKMELVPADKGTYVFIGKPPKMFGLAWVKGEEIMDFKKLGKQKNMTSLDLKPVMDNVKTAYENNAPQERYVTKIADKDIVVAPTAALGSAVEKIIEEAS